MKATMAIQTTTNIQNKVLSRCSVCGKVNKRSFTLLGITKTMHISCDCKRKQLEEEERQNDLYEKNLKIKEFKSMSVLGKRYENVSFDNTSTGVNKSFDHAFHRCKKYCEGYKENISNGYGIYLYGDRGVGKTHITACIVNYLLPKCVPVLITNLFEISKCIKSTFSRETNNTEQEIIRKFSNVPLLIFDDFGTENFIKNSGDAWQQGILFDLINTRYNERKATIFSSNYNLNYLITKRGIFEKTVDRICEMTSGAVMGITGHSMRIGVKASMNF